MGNFEEIEKPERAKDYLDSIPEEQRKRIKYTDPSKVFSSSVTSKIDVPIVGDPESVEEKVYAYLDIKKMFEARDRDMTIKQIEQEQRRIRIAREKHIELENERAITNSINAQKYRRLKRNIRIALPITIVAAIAGGLIACSHVGKKQEKEVNENRVNANITNGFDLSEEDLRLMGLTESQITKWNAFEENVAVYKELMSRYSKDENSLTREELVKLKIAIDEILLFAKRNNQVTPEGKPRADSLSELEKIYRIMIKAPIARATGEKIDSISTKMKLLEGTSISVGDKKYTELCSEYDFAIKYMVEILQAPNMSFDSNDMKSARKAVNVNDIVKCYEVVKMINQGQIVMGENSIDVVSLDLVPSTGLFSQENIEMDDGSR